MRIIIPFGLTPASKRAARYAVSTFGALEDVSITVVHLKEEGKGPSEEDIENTVLSEAEHEVDLNIDLRSFEDELSREKVRRTIHEIIGEGDYDTVVMGYEQKSFFDDMLNETTAERLLEERDLPVVLVP